MRGEAYSLSLAGSRAARVFAVSLDNGPVSGGVGFVITISDPFDYVALTDLLPGASFTVFAQVFSNSVVGISVLDELEGILVSEVVFSESTFPTLTGTVPSSGTIVLRVRSVTSDSDFLTGWQVDVDAPRVVPEPATTLLFALGLAGIGTLRRRG